MASRPTEDHEECVQWITDAYGQRVAVGGGLIALQRDSCVRHHCQTCSLITASQGIKLAPRLWQFQLAGRKPCDFTFTKSSIMIDSTTLLRTFYGELLCLPETEYQLWRKARLCEVSPIVLIIDDVTWRVIASPNAVVEGMGVHFTSDMEPSFRLFLEAHVTGGELLSEVKEAISRAGKDLEIHREHLFKVFHVLGIPPTESHDLSKTALVNFALGRCFHSEGLLKLQESFTCEEAMTLVRRLHLETENHHPEHGSRPALSVIDMYLDRVARAIQFSYGWSQNAWRILDQYVPADYREDFAALEEAYSGVILEDPGCIDIPTYLHGAVIAVRVHEIKYMREPVQ